MTQDIRWQQRFQNFDRAIVMLREPLERDILTLSALEKEGTIQRFQFALEIAWRTLQDYLEQEGQLIEIVTPNSVIKAAFGARILRDAQVWSDMLNHRSLISHKYDDSIFEQTMLAVRERYLAALEELHAWLLERWTSE